MRSSHLCPPPAAAVAELDLSFKEKGIHHLLDFLSRSFHGGTDVDEPLMRSLAKLTEAEWRAAARDVFAGALGRHLGNKFARILARPCSR